MSLADELLADFKENDDEDVVTEEEPESTFIPVTVSTVTEIKVSSVRELAKLRDSEPLQLVMAQIERHSKILRKSTDIVRPVESNPEYQLIVEANNMAVKINNEIATIHRFTRDKYSKRFPELESLVVGSASKMPACNLLVLGSQKTTLSGFSQVTTLLHTGFIYYSEIVQEIPPDLQRKAARLVASKSMLAARVDSCHESTDGYIGQMLREEIEKKLDKLQEPPPVKFVKPLPKPIDPGRKKRGGKRVRKMKERYPITEFRKHANRMNFADIESDVYQEDLGYSRETIGKAGTGRIRLPQIDEKTKVRISKTLQKNLQKQQQWGSSTTVKKQVSGTASSVAFTPLQGLEIINSQAVEKKVNEANAKYFSNTAGFLKVKKM